MSPPEAKDYGIIDAVYSATISPQANKEGVGGGADGGQASEASHEDTGPAAATE
jgi:hypothetical protein